MYTSTGILSYCNWVTLQKHTHKYKVYFKYTLGDILTPKVCNFTKIIGKLFRELGLDLMTHESQFTDQFWYGS